jgi:pentatricopeptide repeat protein
VLQTNTLAELYLRQGLVDRAVEVYRAMLRVDPANERARRRLQELSVDPAAAGPPGARATPAPSPATPSPATPSPATPSPATPSPVAPSPRGDARGRERIASLERWLGRIRLAAPRAGQRPS